MRKQVTLREAPQRSVKTKIELDIYFKATFKNAWDGKG